MFTTVLNLQQLLAWFQESSFDTLLFYVSGYDSGSDVSEKMIQKQYDIDFLTGDTIAYIYFTSDESLAEEGAVSRVTDRSIPKEAIACNCRLAEEVCRHFQIRRMDLPGLLAVSKDDDVPCRLFPVKHANELELYLKPIGVVKAFLEDCSEFYDALDELNSLPHQLERCKVDLKAVGLWRDSLSERVAACQSDPELAGRVEKNYKLLWSRVRALGFKQNVFEAIFSCGPVFRLDVVCRQLSDLGLPEELDESIAELVHDLNAVGNFPGFNSRNGSVSVQVEKVLEEQEYELERLNEKERKLRAVMEEVQTRLQTAGREMERLRSGLDELSGKCVEKLSESFYMNNMADFVKELLISRRMDVLTLLECVQNRGLDVNRMLTKLDRKVQNKEFDTFISCKSQDYAAAYEVFLFLKENGYHPFIAFVSLRELHSDNYGYIIRRIISSCKHMIVYASDLHYLMTSYVSAEWNQYLDELSSGYVHGKLFAIIPENADPADLPPGLRTRQFFTLHGYRELLLDYLGDELPLGTTVQGAEAGVECSAEGPHVFGRVVSFFRKCFGGFWGRKV